MGKQTWVNHIQKNLNGVVDIKPPVPLYKYNKSAGFDLGITFTVYELVKVRDTHQGHIQQPGSSLEILIRIKNTESDPVYIMEVENKNLVYCQLILSKEAFEKTLVDVNKRILRVHQMYPLIWDNYMKTQVPPKKPFLIVVYEFRYHFISVFIPQIKAALKKLSKLKRA